MRKKKKEKKKRRRKRKERSIHTSLEKLQDKQAEQYGPTLTATQQ
jgi:hypothetical protein